MAYFAGKQGAFCRSFTTSVGGASVRPNLTPDGVLAVEGGDPGDPANTVEFTLPVTVEPTGTMATGSATGTLVVKAELRLDGGSDLVLDNVTADASALSGSFKLSLGPTIPAATLEPAFDTAAGHVASQRNGLEILNAVVHTGISGLSVSVGDVTTDGKAFVVGLDWNGEPAAVVSPRPPPPPPPPPPRPPAPRRSPRGPPPPYGFRRPPSRGRKAARAIPNHPRRGGS